MYHFVLNSCVILFVFQEYREMVNTVKILKKETASWRAVINWPQLDEKFKPEDLSTVMKEDKEFPGERK